MGKFPSPCIDICKFKLKGGYCIACGMSKAQKSEFKSLDGGKKQKRFIEDLLKQQAEVKSARTWADEYLRKCRKKGAAPPFELS